MSCFRHCDRGPGLSQKFAPRPERVRLLLAALLVIVTGDAGHADVVRLYSGGEIHGRVLDADQTGGPGELLQVETVNGTRIAIPRDRVDFVLHRPLAAELYELKRRVTPAEVDALWELAEWCRAEDLAEQRAETLERILDLDADHERAHYGLGHRHRDGKWVDYDAYMQAKGYVLHEGRYVVAQELAIIEESRRELAEERNWYPKIRLWHGWLTGEHAGRREKALEQFGEISDSAAIAALRQFLSDDTNPHVRALYLDVLARLKGSETAEALAVSALMDVDETLRHRALEAIDPEHADTAVRAFIRELKNDSNAIVRRAGVALGRWGTLEDAPHLMDALTTTHRYKVTVPGTGAPTYSVMADGSFPNASNAGYIPPEVEHALRSGQLPYGAEINYVPMTGSVPTHTVTIRREERNPEVLAALTKLTGRDFGYDLRMWKLWWMAQKTDDGRLKDEG